MKEEPDQTQVKTNQTDDADVRAVKDVIFREINAFLARDFEAWQDCYLHSDRLRSVMMSHDLGLDVRKGWTDFAESVRLHFEATAPHDSTWEKNIEQVEILGDIAWLICRARTDSSQCMMRESYETLILERDHGAWKIVCFDVLATRSYRNRERRIAVDAEGFVVDLESAPPGICASTPPLESGEDACAPSTVPSTENSKPPSDEPAPCTAILNKPPLPSSRASALPIRLFWSVPTVTGMRSSCRQSKIA